MTISASSNGIVEGYFLVTPKTRLGAKGVEFIGAITTATAELPVYTRHYGNLYRTRVSVQVRREIYTGADPIAQTFTVDRPQLLCGAAFQFAAKGPTNVICEIRETTVGFPNQTVLANAMLTPDDVPAGNLAEGVWTQFSWYPIPLTPGQEYAVILICDDPTWAVRIATLGEVDTSTWTPITEQPYTVGVLLKSSNLSSWTIDQYSDLTFRLFAPSYSITSQTVTLGTANVTSAELIQVAVAVDRPHPDTDVHIHIQTSATTYDTYENVPVTIGTPGYTGVVTVTATLIGTENASPVIHKDITVAAGHGLGTGSYITKAIPCASSGGTCRATFGMNAYVAGGSSIEVTAQTGTDGGGDPVWSGPFDIARDDSIGNGWTDRVYTLSELTVTETRFRVVLTGTVSAPAFVRNIYAYTVESI